MLGPRTRSAAQRAARAEQTEVRRNENDNDDAGEPKRAKHGEQTHAQTPGLPPNRHAANLYAALQKYIAFSVRLRANSQNLSNYFRNHSRITVVTMTGAAIAIDDVSAVDTILCVKQRVFSANPKMYVRRQRLVYSAGPRGMDALADDETLGGAGVPQDGSAELDVLLADLTAAEEAELGPMVFF